MFPGLLPIQINHGCESLGNPQDPEFEENDETVVQETPIAKLNFDCLDEILSYLSLRERVIAGQVCRSWREINITYWQSIKRLDFTKPPFKSVNLNDKQLKYFLDHCPYITHLNINKVLNDLTSESVVAIANQCPNLVEIQIRDSKLLINGFALLGQYCRKLTSFRCDDCSEPYSPYELLAFLENATKLEILYLRRVLLVSLWMRRLNPPLRSLVFDQCVFSRTDTDIFIESIDKLKNTLTELTIISRGDAFLRSENEFSFITKSLKLCQKLTSVSINVPNSCNLMPLADLKDLKKLNLHFVRFRSQIPCDDHIKMIAKRCLGLESFAIENYISISGLKFIRYMKNLKHLSITYQAFMTDDLIDEITRNLSKLEHLCLTGCYQITKSGCIKVLKNCNELTLLDVTNCNCIDNSLVFSAIEDRIHGGKKQLTIIVTNTQVSDDVWIAAKKSFFWKETGEIMKGIVLV